MEMVTQSTSTCCHGYSGRRPGLTLATRWRYARPCFRQRDVLRTVATISQATRLRNSSQGLSAPVDVAIARPPYVAVEVGDVPLVPNALAAARSLFAALNQRDVSAVLSLLEEDVSYENLGSSSSLRGRAAVGRFYLEALATLPEDAVFVLEGQDGAGTDPRVSDAEAAGGPVLQAGVAWRVELHGIVVPLSRGVGVYWADPRTGRLARVWDNPEHTVKLTTPALTSAAWASPLLGGLGPLVLPAVTSFLNNLTPGGSGGDSAAGGLASSPGALASGVMSTLTSMMPFQPPPPPTPSRGAESSAGRGGGGSSTAAGASGNGASVAARSSSLSSSRPATLRSSAFSPSSGTGDAAISGNGTAVAVAMRNSASAGVSVSAGVGAGSAPRASVATPAAAISTTVTTSAAAATTMALSGPVSSASTSALLPAPASLLAMVGAGAGGDDVAMSTRGERIRMRSLPDPGPSSSPLASAASFASLDEEIAGAAVGPSSATVPVAMPAAAAAVATASVPVIVIAAPTAVTASDSINSLASFDGACAPSVVGGKSLPFVSNASFIVNLTGLWEKDAAASQVQEYESMLDVLELGGLQKVTARLIDGLDLLHDEGRFEVSFVTVVPFFRVTEKSRFGGVTTMMRRDLRSGRQTALATRISGGVTVDMSWEAPLAGSLREEYVASDDGQKMAVISTICIGQRTVTAMQVYRRSSLNKSEFLASQRSGYGSMADVLQNQEKQYGKVK